MNHPAAWLTVPPVFLQRLQAIVGAPYYAQAVANLFSPPVLSVRVNTLKTTRSQVLAQLRERNIFFREVPWLSEAMILEGLSREECAHLDLLEKGFLYRQGLASMLPVLVLGPQPGERILDMCAAPGGKTTQIAAQMNNIGEIVALEAIRARYYKLKSVIRHCGVTNVLLQCIDARRYRANRLFDRILVDAPCSAEGRFKRDDPKTYAYWSLRKIKEMARKQKGLLLCASRLLKPGGTLVYATCTFAPEENEAVVDWLVKKTAGRLAIQPISFPDITRCPVLGQWEGRAFNPAVQEALRILPDPSLGIEGFFMVRFIALG